jgi:signal transduction histidine kinase
MTLNPGVDLAAYRIVQEALTNVRRHARAAGAWVTLHRAAAALEIEIRDDGSVRSTRGAGHGLIGMRERALLYGGQLTAGPADGGGFRVHVVLPLEAGE